jgi:hypothetical protein
MKQPLRLIAQPPQIGLSFVLDGNTSDPLRFSPGVSRLTALLLHLEIISTGGQALFDKTA